MKKKSKILLITSLLLMMLFTMVGCGDSDDGGLTIDLNKYITVNVTGYNSMGKVEVNFDYDAFEKDWANEIVVNAVEGKTNNAEMNLELNLGTKPYKVLLNYCTDFEVVGELEKASNGDTLKISWECDDTNAKNYFGCKLKYSDIEYKVEGLKEVSSFDPFQYVTVEYTGIAPNGRVEVKVNTDKKEMQYITFKTSQEYDHSNGDVVVITAEIDNVEDFVNEFNALPSPSSKEYTVEGLPSYVSSMTNVKSDKLDEIKKQAEEIYSAKWEKLEGNLDGLKGLTYLGNYFLTKKDPKEYGDTNRLYMVYKVDAEYDGNKYPHYVYVMFANISLDTSGNCIVDFENHEESDDRWKPIDGDPFFYYFGYGTLEDIHRVVAEDNSKWYIYEKNMLEN